MSSVIKEGRFTDIGKEIAPDDRKRLTLGPALPDFIEGLRYRVFCNERGQILLDPVVSIPAYESWLYTNPKRIAAIKKGIDDIEAGRVVSIKLPPDE